MNTILSLDEPTLFILGAGSNQYYNFPSGPDLKKRMIQNVQSGDFLDIAEQVDDLKEQCNPFAIALKDNRYLTIDEFMEQKQKWRNIGAHLIAYTLLPAEKRSHDIMFPQKDLYAVFYDLFRFEDEKPPPMDIAFITLNYDRSLEHFFHHNIFCNCKDDLEEAAYARLKEIPIVHLYESFGMYPQVKYGTDVMSTDGTGKRVPAGDFLDAAKNIKIISDDLSGSAAVKRAYKVTKRAKNIVFLGLSYDPRTLGLLIGGISKEKFKDKHVFGTTIDLPEDRKNDTDRFFEGQMEFLARNVDATLAVATLFGHASGTEEAKQDLLLGPRDNEDDPFRIG